MFLPFRILLLWDVRMAFHFEDWRAISGGRIDAWFRAIAEVEALLSLASHAYENPEDIFPEIDDSRLLFHARGLGHPLLPKDRGVRNDVSLDEEVRLLMVSGSNMSGKSTLLRAFGLNLVIALAGGTVRATELRVSPLQIGATIRVQDSLQDGRSRFFAEVSRVRGVLEAAEKGRFPLLFLLDELFSGTNSSDRERGAEGVLKKLLELRTLGLVTTHDLALTRIGERFGERARNVHFADEVIDGQLHFDYRMKPGVVPHGNGVALMRMVGLEV
jgi:DNA mismatch repair ATPase MutS